MTPLDRMLARPARADMLVAGWVTLWIALGVVTGVTVHGLTELSDTTVKAGNAAAQAGQVLGLAGDVPLLGAGFRAQAQTVQQLGESAQRSGEDSKSTITRLAWLLGFAIAVIPSVPLLVFYIPARLEQRRRGELPGPD